MLWPAHCIQGSHGAELSADLKVDKINRIIRKGTDSKVDSYSAFFDNGHNKSTGLADYLKEQGAGPIFVMGLATDYCVKFTALDASHSGFETFLVEDGCRGVELRAGDVQRSLQEMEAAGVRRIASGSLLASMQGA